MYLTGQRRISMRGSGSDLQRQEGFTLIELLIVVAIISILAAIAIPNFLQAQIRGKVARAVTDQSMIAAALDTYYVDYEQYPFNNLLVEAVVSSSEAARPSRQPLRARGFLPSPFVMAEPQSPEPILLDTSETTGVLETARMIPMPRGTVEPFRSAKPTTITVVREIPYSSKIQIGPHPWQLCSSCGTVNAQTVTRCAGCGRQLEPSDRYMIYNQSLNGAVLSVLTTPIAYLPTEVNVDIFNRRRGRRYGTPTTGFVYVNYLQIHPEGVAIPLVGRRVHYAIISYGPDTGLDYIHSDPTPHILIYDPTNGTISPGDVINFGQ